MRGEKFCYYHHQTRKPSADAQQRQARRNAFGLPKPTSRAAIQEALGEIISRIGHNAIDPRRAGLLLSTLQLASTYLSEQQRANSESTQSEPATQTAPDVLPTLQATHETEPNPSDQLRPQIHSPWVSGQPEPDPQSGKICFSTQNSQVIGKSALVHPGTQMSPNCRVIVISSHKVLLPEHLAQIRHIRRYITYLS
jgi:hypothetical protein